jgi:adenylate kinase family enzyme
MRILITGAAGSGTTTLAQSLAVAMSARHVEADDFFWMPTNVPYTVKRPIEERLKLMEEALHAADAVVAGSVMGWGRSLEDAFDLIVFLQVDAGIRVQRLVDRETARFGRADPAFIDWAAQYDDGPPEGRSLARHEAWLSARQCPVLRLTGPTPVDMQVHQIRDHLASR